MNNPFDAFRYEQLSAEDQRAGLQGRLRTLEAEHIEKTLQALEIAVGWEPSNERDTAIESVEQQKRGIERRIEAIRSIIEEHYSIEKKEEGDNNDQHLF